LKKKGKKGGKDFFYSYHVNNKQINK